MRQSMFDLTGPTYYGPLVVGSHAFGWVVFGYIPGTTKFYHRFECPRFKTRREAKDAARQWAKAASRILAAEASA